jgi:hypothetical protein
MEEDFSEFSTYLLIKRYKSEQDKNSPKAIELERLIRKDLNLSTDIDFSSTEIQDKLNKIFRESNRKNEKFITITAWIFIALTGLGLLGSGCSLMSVSSTSKLLPKVESMLSENINPIAKFMIENQILLSVFSFILLFIMLIVSVGVLYRSNIARKIAVILLVFKIAQNFVEPLLIKYVYPSFHDLKIDVPKSIADGMYQASIIMSIFFSIIFIVVYGWLIYKFTSPEITEEFN